MPWYFDKNNVDGKRLGFYWKNSSQNLCSGHLAKKSLCNFLAKNRFSKDHSWDFLAAKRENMPSTGVWCLFKRDALGLLEYMSNNETHGSSQTGGNTEATRRKPAGYFFSFIEREEIFFSAEIEAPSFSSQRLTVVRGPATVLRLEGHFIPPCLKSRVVSLVELHH